MPDTKIKNKYKILMSQKIDLGRHIVLAENPEKGEFVTWFVDADDEYNWGHYFPHWNEMGTEGRLNTLEDAFADFIKRVRENI